jgi:hypothetical protein
MIKILDTLFIKDNPSIRKDTSMVRIPVAGDGACAYRAVLMGYYNDSKFAFTSREELRLNNFISKVIRKAHKMFGSDLGDCNILATSVNDWADYPELVVMSKIFRAKLIVHDEDSDMIYPIVFDESKCTKTIHLSRVNSCHYELLLHKNYRLKKII